MRWWIANSILRILSQCISDDHIVHFKYLISLFANNASIKLKKEKICSFHRQESKKKRKTRNKRRRFHIQIIVTKRKNKGGGWENKLGNNSKKCQGHKFLSELTRRITPPTKGHEFLKYSSEYSAQWIQKSTFICIIVKFKLGLKKNAIDHQRLKSCHS